MSDPGGDGILANADVRLFETGNFADATIVCGDRAWKVHKALLSSRCKLFEHAFFGNMAEAASGKIVLEEQDPDIIHIMLRFIYSKDLTILKLANGKGIPALCVKLFRVAEFFLLGELRSKVNARLRVYLDALLAIPSTGDIKNTPARMLEIDEVLESIREAYKDNSTEYLRQKLLNFLWMKNDRVFQVPKVMLLLTEIPGLGKDLMLSYIACDGTTHLHDGTKPPQGLRVLDAIRAPDKIYKAGDKKGNKKGRTKVFCILRHTPGRPSPFEAVNAQTGVLIPELAWITPATCRISSIGSYETSEIVCVGDSENRNELWLRFETAGDARYYAACHSGVDRFVRQDRLTKTQLQGEMSAARARVV
ncbi:hypothetical protein INS49_014406 [Diaporthe citri]|uniref:uncharacterized protein n=1 Tax=Diaporthe citri TaxID=83186 RepID=UPI001C7FE6F4|nr:uncharacterized protein INS49_014406 [Diaporthe citri]KAG6358522.1 hypothetical protein INS49_014406 [Diaporthe citri]